jgi:pimeloyl-ACP methyl ester carboxylesterase
MDDRKQPTIVCVPCLAGAPWKLEQFQPLAHRPLKTMRLPDDAPDIEAYADYVADRAASLDRFVLVGDSFGANVSLALATRRPRGLCGLVLSGGFAARPVADPLLGLKIRAARFLPGFLYRQLTLRMHAAALSSQWDAEGEIEWSRERSRQLFVENTPWRAYVGRTRASFEADYRPRLSRIDVPTFILTPSDDKLIGKEAAAEMLNGIPDATEQILDRTGHMFRYTHPRRYAGAVEQFLRSRVDSGERAAA